MPQVVSFPSREVALALYRETVVAHLIARDQVDPLSETERDFIDLAFSGSQRCDTVATAIGAARSVNVILFPRGR